MSIKNNNNLFAILVGAALGVVLGILFAPDKGSKTREKINDSLDDLKDQAKSKWNSLEEEAKDLFTKSKDDFKETIETILSNSSYKTEESISFLEEKLAELKKNNAKFQK